jgi:hypothetical protein
MCVYVFYELTCYNILVNPDGLVCAVCDLGFVQILAVSAILNPTVNQRHVHKMFECADWPFLSAMVRTVARNQTIEQINPAHVFVITINFCLRSAVVPFAIGN